MRYYSHLWKYNDFVFLLHREMAQKNCWEHMASQQFLEISGCFIDCVPDPADCGKFEFAPGSAHKKGSGGKPCG